MIYKLIFENTSALKLLELEPTSMTKLIRPDANFKFSQRNKNGFVRGINYEYIDIDLLGKFLDTPNHRYIHSGWFDLYKSAIKEHKLRLRKLINNYINKL